MNLVFKRARISRAVEVARSEKVRPAVFAKLRAVSAALII
jgi:hypothetical protein